MMQALDLTFPSDNKAPRNARRALETLTKDLPQPLLEDARLLVSELVTNCVRHADAPLGAVIRLTVHLLPEAVRIEVSDSGRGFEPFLSTPTMYQTSGWGLYLVEQIAKRWGVNSGPRGQVWFELDRPIRQPEREQETAR